MRQQIGTVNCIISQDYWLKHSTTRKLSKG
jgi:hypothetical protein